MRIGRSIQIVLVALGAVLVGLGLGPLIVAGISDLTGSGANSIGAASIVITILIGTTFALGLVCIAERISRSLNWLRHPKLGWIAAGSITLAAQAVFIAGIDGGNNTAWRSSALLAVGLGVTKQPMRELGRHFARLRLPGPEFSGGQIGNIPVDWRLWIAGGQSDILVRSNATAADNQAVDCEANDTLRIAAAGRVDAPDRAIPLADICGEWLLVRIDLPRRTTELQFILDRAKTGGEIHLDIMLAAYQPRYDKFWRLCKVLAIGVVLAIVSLLSLNLREQGRVAKPGSGKPRHTPKLRGLITGGLIFVFVLVSNLFMYWYVSQEKTIYTWDYSGYWTSSRHVSDFLRGGERKSAIRPIAGSQDSAGRTAGDQPDRTIPDPGALGALIRNIRFSEYNVSSNLPVAPVMAVFGGSRMVYELSLLNIYALAAVLMLIVAVRGFGGREVAHWQNWWPALPIIAVICFVPFWIPIVRGYMGVSVAAVNLAVLWLYFRQPAREISTTTLFVIGGLLLSGVILQRWNAYWVIGFFLIAIADGIWPLLVTRRINVLEFLRAMRAPLVSGFAAFFLFAVFAWPKVVRMVTTDYADIYSAFQDDASLLAALARQVDAFGVGTIGLLVIAFLFLVRQTPFRRLAILIGAQVLYVFLHFSSTQTMGPHQYFLILPGMLIIMSLALICGISDQKRSIRMTSAGAATLLLVVGIASGQSVFVPTETGAIPSPNRLLSQSYRPPLVNQDLDEFIRLARFLDEHMADALGEQGIYVLSGSEILNANHFDTISASTGAPFDSVDRILGSAVVDKRDGFPRGIFQAYLVVTSDPLQLSRRPADQHVLRIPADRIFGGTGIGAAFEKLPATFRLDGDVDAVVFRRTRPNTVDEIADLSNALRDVYPDRPGVYRQ